MRRRDFILGVSLASAWPFAVAAQQAGKVPRIGFLGAASPSTFASRLEGIRLGLRDYGYVEGKNITIEYRWAEGRCCSTGSSAGFVPLRRHRVQRHARGVAWW